MTLSMCPGLITYRLFPMILLSVTFMLFTMGVKHGKVHMRMSSSPSGFRDMSCGFPHTIIRSGGSSVRPVAGGLWWKIRARPSSEKPKASLWASSTSCGVHKLRCKRCCAVPS